MSRSSDELSDSGSDDGIDPSDAIFSECRPCAVILKRLDPVTIDFWLKRGDLGTIGQKGKRLKQDGTVTSCEDMDLCDDEEDDFVSEEAKIGTIDLTDVNLEDLKKNSSQTSSKSSRLKLDEKIFCLFNLEEFDDRYEAKQAFYRELRYAPLRCLECDEATVELKDMIDHYLNQHPGIKLVKYKEEQVPAKEKWVAKFIDYQIQCMNDEDEMLPNDIVNKYCPVCNQYDYILKASQSKNKLKVSHILDMNHINKHLRYNPYECLLCKKRGKRYAISSVNKKAQDHLMNRHNIVHPTDAHVRTHFQASATIPELENFLRDYIGIIKGSERQFAKPVVKRRVLAGKSTKQNNNRGKQTGKLYKAASKTCKKMKETRESVRNGKKANSKSIVEDTEDADLEDIETIREESHKFFCIFCSEKNLSDIYIAWGHYGNHLKYMPIVCQICNKRFTSDTTFRYHGIEHVEHSDLPFTRNCDEAIETWGHDFLEGLANDSEAKPEFSAFCPVCEKIFSKPVEIPNINVSHVKSHIYSHLKYLPFECLKCQGQATSTFVGDLDYQAALHLSSAHSLTVTPAEISKYFVKSRGIESLDKLLRDHFEKIQYLIGSPILNFTTPALPNEPLEFMPNDIGSILHNLEETLGTNTLNNLLNNAVDSDQQQTFQNNISSAPSSVIKSTPTRTFPT